jgi:hypothetical protein
MALRIVDVPHGEARDETEGALGVSIAPTIAGKLPTDSRGLPPVRSTESSGFMERAMGSDPNTEAWEGFARCFDPA